MKRQYMVTYSAPKCGDIEELIFYNGSKRYFKDKKSAIIAVNRARLRYPELKLEKFTIKTREVTDWEIIEEF